MFRKRNANKMNITHGQGKVLLILNKKDGISTKELSEILNIKVTSLNETLNKLQEQEFIEKRPSPNDKRVLLIYLTPKARKFKCEKPKDINIFDCLDNNQKEELNKYLTLIIDELNEKMFKENPEKFEKMIKQRQKILKILNNEL
jgi:DNA-binding MarR family transcriptional regulator